MAESDVVAERYADICKIFLCLIKAPTLLTFIGMGAGAIVGGIVGGRAGILRGGAIGATVTTFLQDPRCIPFILNMTYAMREIIVNFFQPLWNMCSSLAYAATEIIHNRVLSSQFMNMMDRFLRQHMLQ